MLTGFAFGGMSEVRLREGEFLFGRWQPPPQFMVRGAGGCTSSPYYPPTMVTATPILPPTVLPPPALSCPGSCSPQAQCPGPLRASWGYAATGPQSWETSWQVGGGNRLQVTSFLLHTRQARFPGSSLAVDKQCAPPSLLPRQARAAGLLRRGLPPALPGGLGWWSGWSCDRAGCGLVGPVSHGSFRQVDRVYIGWLHC